jgi:hypothetical protein
MDMEHLVERELAGRQSTRRKSALRPLCRPQIPHGLTYNRTQAAVVGSCRLRAYEMAQPNMTIKIRGSKVGECFPKGLKYT